MVKFRHFFYTTFFVGVLLMALYGFKEENNTRTSLDDTEYHMSVQYPPCLQMYYNIEKYSEKYNIPKQYAYGIAYRETKYRSPFQWGYNHRQLSGAGALGPMQVMLSTARWVWHDNSITKQRVLTDIEFNVETSMKYLNILHRQYKDWKVVFGCYNTGRPIINNYAMNVYQHKN